MPDLETILRRFEWLSESIREQQLKLSALQQERDALRNVLRHAPTNPFALDVGNAIFTCTKTASAPLTQAEREAVEVIRRDGGVADRTWLADRLNISLDAANTRLVRCYSKGL